MRRSPTPGRVALFAAGWIVAAAAFGQNYEIFRQLENTGVSNPNSPLIEDEDGSFYGTSLTGGTGDCERPDFDGCGTIYRLDPDGTVTILHSFQPNEGTPFNGLILASSGDFYGTTFSDSPTCPCGTIYRLSATGTVTTVHTFQGDDGKGPSSPLIEPADGDLWGTTSSDTTGRGTVFRMHFDGGFATMHTLAGDEGTGPLGALAVGDDGNIYGTTTSGGASFTGTFYRITSNGNWTTIADLPTDTSNVNGLTKASSGDFLGTSFAGGAFGTGSVFRVSPSGEFETLHSLAENQSEGYLTLAAPARAGNSFYGGAFHGGVNDRGTLFRVDTTGAFDVVHEFDAPPDGAEPTSTMLFAADGNLYGVAASESGGLVYRISLAPPPIYYCPTSAIRRDQMAVFLLKTVHGAAFTPPACEGDFDDVLCPGLFTDWIEQFATEGFTAGCAPGSYCPLSPLRRDQMAVFLLKAAHGSDYTPPPCTGTFDDVLCPSLFADWVEALADEGITAGCGNGDTYCPDSPVTRAQMAVFLLKVEHGDAYSPPACTGVFGDVVCPSTFAAWIEQLYAEHITGGCGGPS